MPITPILKSRIFKLALSLVIIAIIINAVMLYLQYQMEKRSEQTFYKAFGISIPSHYKLNGIDVSKHQSYIYWTSVKQMKIDSIAIDFVFIKATEGLNDVDGMYKRNWQLSNQNNIPHGAYHYFIASKNGKKQAQNFIKNVILQKGDLPPVIDVEQDFGVDAITLKINVVACLNELEKHYGVKPILYSYIDFYNNYLGKDFDNYPLWIAHYTEQNEPNISRDWLFWQHSESGRVSGITEKVDFNVFTGDSTAFSNLLIK